MVKLAINYSRPALDLRRRGRLAVDLLKCPDWPDHWDEFALAGPVYIHFRHMAGAGRMQNVDWEQTALLRKRSGSPFVNLHIAPYMHWLSADSSPDAHEPSFDEVFALACADVEQASRQFGAENVIIENAPYRDGDGRMARAGVEPELFHRLTRETGCGLLLDLSHARITARQLGWAEEAYIQALPLDRLRELHITGLEMNDGVWLDHYPMTSEDWPSAEWAIRNIRTGRWAEPWVATFEYGGVGPGYEERTDAAIIEEQMNRFVRMWRPS
jgi:uncharacterized protein